MQTNQSNCLCYILSYHISPSATKWTGSTFLNVHKE